MNIQLQPELRPALPSVIGPKDYQQFRETLIEMDRILDVSGIENNLITRLLDANHKESSPAVLSAKYIKYRSALRCSIILSVTGLSLRDLEIALSDSRLFAWFMGSEKVDEVKGISKSTIERYSKKFDSEDITHLIHDLNNAVADQETAATILYREAELKMDQIFADTTCVKTNIHFPVDWVLLRDATRTLVLAIILIRKHGLKHRIGKPELLMNEMNKLCIKMTHTRKKKDGQKVRKSIFRKMKKLMKTIEAHGMNYRNVLEDNWIETDWTEVEARIVIERMDNILNQLPKAISQAHERIIGKRRVANKDKVLSFYEPDTRVIVRGKAGAEVEFGNALYLAEQEDGLIVDWNFIQEQPPADSKLVEGSIDRIKESHGEIRSYTGDRGFDAAGSRSYIEDQNIINGVCPRSVKQLEEKLTDEYFCFLQTRRSQTEGRIGILKNAYLGNPLRSKGFENRQIRIELNIFTHNLWKIAKMAAQAKASRFADAA